MKASSILLLVVIALSLNAAPIVNESHSFNQPDGSEVPVVLNGDEFYTRIATPNNYTLTRDDEGWLCYADVSDDQSTLIPLERYTNSSEAPAAVTPGITLSYDAIRGEIEKVKSELGYQSQPRSRALLPGSYSQPPSKVVGLTVIIDFPDTTAKRSVSEAEDFLNGENYTGEGTVGSVRQWMLDVSEGKLDYTNVTYSYRAKYPFSYYNVSGTAGSMNKTLAKEAIAAMVADGFDFSQLTLMHIPKYGNPDNMVWEPMINMLFYGKRSGSAFMGGARHYTTLDCGNGISASSFVMLSAYESSSYTTFRLGSFIHESGHLLFQFEDLYPNTYYWSTKTVDRYCVMATGGVSGSSGMYNPTAFNPYFREMAGWLKAEDITGQTNKTIRVTPSELGDVKHWHNNDYTERYYIDARKDEGRSSRIPSSGIIVWRVNQNGSSNKGPTALIEVVQRGGIDSDFYEAEDLYYDISGPALNSSTTPSSNWIDGSASGLDMRNVSPYGSTMTFDLGLGGTIEEPDSFTVELISTNGTAVISNEQAKYEANSSVELSAVAASGYEFTHWSGDYSGTDNPAAITVTSNMTITANFTPVTQDSVVLTLKETNTVVEVSQKASKYERGTEVTLTAAPQDSFYFVGWFGDTSTSAEVVTTTLESNTSLEAYSFPIAYPDSNMVSQAHWAVNASGDAGTEGTLDSSDLNSEYRVRADLSVAQDAGYNSYAELGAHFDGDFTNLQSITLSYSATKEIRLELYDDSTYSNPPVIYSLPPAERPTTVTILRSELTTRADWGTDYSAALDFSKVSGLSFNIVGSDDIAQKSVEGVISISEIQLSGYEEGAVSQILKQQSISRYQVTAANNTLRLHLPTATSCSIEVLTLAGRKISSINTGPLTSGVHTVGIGSHAAGIYLVRVRSDLGIVTQRVILDR